MINSCPRKASPTRAALALGATRMVSSCTSVPRWASAKAKVEVARRTAAAIAARPDCEFRNGSLSDWRVYPPPPRSIGIIELAPKRDLIYWLQQLTGKIFKTKEIRAEHCCFHSVSIGCLVSARSELGSRRIGGVVSRCTVTGSMIAD